MNIYRKSFLNLNWNFISIIQKSLYSTSNQFEPYPYTSSLFRKNYIQYGKQSLAAVQHDYVYSGDERLPTLEERLKEYEDPLDKRSTVNIGFSVEHDANHIKKLKEDAFHQFKNNKENQEFCQKARTLTLSAPIDKINEDWNKYSCHEEIKIIGEHYNIYKDLYDCGYFYPAVLFDVKYECKSDKKSNDVKYGNKIDAKYTIEKPSFNLNNLNEKKFYTLTFLNLDGNLKDNNNEMLLWFISNLNKETNINGDEIFRYLQPFPMRGTGWHRCVYVLYEHDDKIDYDEYFLNKLEHNRYDLDKRSFKTLDFYLKYQNLITPVSYLFFQTQWDLSVKNVFYNLLDMKEPVYEYDFGKRFVPAQEKHPKGQVFNWYLDEYKDIKDINEDVLKTYLKQLSPFEDYPKPLKYPLIEKLKCKNSPRWYYYELNDYKYRRHKWSSIPFEYAAMTLQEENCIKSLPYQVQNETKK